MAHSGQTDIAGMIADHIEGGRCIDGKGLGNMKLLHENSRAQSESQS
jgi:hypothetical protein